MSTVRADSAGRVSVHVDLPQFAVTVEMTLAWSAPGIGRNPEPRTVTRCGFPALPDFGETLATLGDISFLACVWQASAAYPGMNVVHSALFALSPPTIGAPSPPAMS